MSVEHQKAKEQFMEKERENARMEAKRRKLMEKRVRKHHFVHSGLVVVVFLNFAKPKTWNNPMLSRIGVWVGDLGRGL